jgi:hypothetical protein
MADPIRNLLDELNAALDASGEQSAEVQKNLKARRDRTKEILDNEQEVTSENFKQADLQDDLIKAIRTKNKEEEKELRLLIARGKAQKRINDQVEYQVGLGKDLVENTLGQLKNIPVFGDFLYKTLNIEGLAEKTGDKIRESITQGFVEGGTSGLVEAGLGRGAGRLLFFAKAGFVALGIGAAAFFSQGLQQSLEKGMGFGGTGRGIAQTLFFGDKADAFEKEFGQINALSDELARDLAFSEQRFGLSNENAALLTKRLTDITDQTEEQVVNNLKSVAALAKQNDVAPKKVMEDLAANAEMFSEFTRDGGESLQRASIEANKLGLGLDTISKISEKLLDFEGSITSELEAQVLTGKSLNLDRARQLALAGKTEELQREIIKQVGSEAELQRLNVIERRSLANAIGVSVSELTKLAQGEKVLESVAQQQLSVLQSIDRGIQNLGGNGGKAGDVAASV